MKELFIVAFLSSFTLGEVLGLEIILPEVIEVNENDNLLISCNVTRYSGPMESIQFYWTKSSNLIQSNQILKIELIKPDQSGIYTCYAVVDRTVYNSSTSVSVSYAPSWVKENLRKFPGALGTSASLNCTVDAHPSPSFLWITADNNSLPVSSGRYLIETSANTSILQLNSLVQSDYGFYVCEANNRAGKGIYKLQLMSPGVPDSPRGCDSVSLNSDSVVLKCLEGYRGTNVSVNYIVKAYTSSSSTLVAVSVIISHIGYNTVLLNITGLSPKQGYTLDIYESNQYGDCDEPLSLYINTVAGPLIVTRGSTDSSKIIAIAVCLVVLVVIIIVALTLVLYCCYKKNKFKTPIQTDLISHSLNNFSAFASVLQRNRSNSKEQILSDNKTETRSNNCHINSGFIDDGTSVRTQPSLAGCGALITLRVPVFSKSLKFVPGRSTGQTDDLEQENKFNEISKAGNDKWEFPRDQFFLRKKIGDGSFGEVWEARIESSQNDGGGRIVAVKMLKDNFTNDERQCMVDEMEVMKSIQFHPNIIQLIGCCTSSYPLCLITEYASRGTLLDLLRQQRLSSGIKLTTKDVESFTLQIASAMEHITFLQLVHRDFAARSVLLSNHLICKLGDFEKSQHFQDGNMKKKGHRIQVRWLPPESLFVTEQSTKSNIWSFGILVWECFTLGSTPYPGMNNKEVVDFVQRGGRMPKPNFCSEAMYEVVQDCWVYYPHKRPTFIELKQKVERIYETSPTLQIDFVTGEYDSKSWNASPQDLGELI